MHSPPQCGERGRYAPAGTLCRVSVKFLPRGTPGGSRKKGDP